MEHEDTFASGENPDTEIDPEAPTQVVNEEQMDQDIDPEAPTQVQNDEQESQVDPDAPTQVPEDVDTEAATQMETQEVDPEAPTQVPDATQIDTEAPTQVPDDEESATQIDTEAPTQVPDESQVDPEAPTQIETESSQVDPEAPTQVEQRKSRSRSRSHSGSRSSVARSSRSRSRSGSPRSRGSRSRSGSRSSRSSRSGSRRSVSRSKSRSRSRSGSPRSRASRSRSRSRSRSGSRSSRSSSRARSVSRSRSRSRSRSGSESGDDIGKAKKRVVREAFGGGSDNESGSDVEGQTKKKRKRIVSGGAEGDDSEDEEKKTPENEDQGEAQEGQEAAPEGGPVLPADSDSDEGVQEGASGGVGAGEFVSDFDLMMERKKAERRRRRKKDIDLINDNDDAIAKMIADMRLAAREDREKNAERQPAIKKISMLPVVMTQLRKADLQAAFVEANVLSVLTDWLAPMPDKSLPVVQIRKAILSLLNVLRIDDHTRLKESGIGKAVMYLYKHPRELRENKVLAGKIINNWARPIFNLSTDYKSISKEERQERDEMISSRKRSVPEPVADADEPQKPGDKGWCYRARVPQASAAAYVNRPKWSSDVEFTGKQRGGAKPGSRFDKYIKVASEKKKGFKTKRAVEISIEGRKMAL